MLGVDCESVCFDSGSAVGVGADCASRFNVFDVLASVAVESAAVVSAAVVSVDDVPADDVLSTATRSEVVTAWVTVGSLATVGSAIGSANGSTVRF